MLSDLDNYYLRQEEPVKSCLLAMREIVLASDPEVTAAWKYGMPMFCYKGKMFCYLWVHKKHKQPYLGLVEGSSFKQPELLQEKRSRMKILLVNPGKDLPVVLIRKLLKQALQLYKSGAIPIK